MKRIDTAEGIRELGTILVVGAHPDDEIFIAGGIMAAAAGNGQRVACVTATRGEAGVQDEARWPKAQLAEIRARELEASLSALGTIGNTFLGYKDGECTNADFTQACENLQTVVGELRPDTILTFGPDGYTGHPDHQTVSRWTSSVAGAEIRVLWAVLVPEQYEQMTPVDKRANIFFNTNKPPLVRSEDCAVDFRLEANVMAMKRRAFEAVPSQFEKLLGARPFEVPGDGLARECFVTATGGKNG